MGVTEFLIVIVNRNRNLFPIRLVDGQKPPGHAPMNDALIELRHVDVTLNGAAVLREISWSLRAGEHWLIRGANGSGKSTFLRLLRGEVWSAPNRGERIYRFDDSTQTTAIEVRSHVAFVSPEIQERYLQQEWHMTGRDVIHTGFAQTDLLYVKLTREQRRHAQGLAETLGITPLLGRDMQTLSTGELRKILIARAVAGSPRVLLLDEVCDGLDAKFRRELLNMIEAIARRGTQVVYTTHRADEPLSVITHVAEFDGGRIVRTNCANHADAFDRSRSSAALLAEEEIHDRLPGHRTSSAPLKTAARRPLNNATRQKHSPLIQIENADVFLDRTKVLHGVHWQMRRGEHWAVLGGNGAGKTTFLKLIASELYPAFGARVGRFEFTADNTIWDLRRRIGCVSPLLQAHYRAQLTGEQAIASGFFSSIGLMDRPTPSQVGKVRALLREFDLEHLCSRSMLAMSFGELRKVLTLRALVQDPELLIFDEPFDGLDADSRRDFAAALERVADRGAQLLVVTHHLDDLPRCITHGLFLERGRVIVADEWRKVRAHSKVMELFGAG
jgi:molybdate transport system ATP-binding protein